MAQIAFLSCHLTGTGHLVRTGQLARAAIARGHTTAILSGGRTLDHLEMPGEFLQLPPVTVRGFEFGVLHVPGGAKATDAYMEARSAELTSHIARLRPDILVTELFPFGRRVLAVEFLAAIAAARAARSGACIVCSVRDIPEPKPKRLAEAAGRLRAHYDAVLVHGDAGLVPLAATWPLPADVMEKVHHTGYVGRPMPPISGPAAGNVLVSAGGGTLGRQMLAIAAQAASLSPHPWHILVGGADAAEVCAGLLADHRAPNLTIEPARPDYRTMLATAGCSVSLCGYNTAVELATCHTPAILVPSEEADEKEQLIRARHLADAPGIELCRLEDLSPDGLAATAGRLVTAPRRPTIPLTVDDGTGAIVWLERLLEGPAR